ncbi:MAG: hypothetical protein EA396_06140 [Anaerolineaceae bacterium]|nr:MAG: hypothetical protein EA396_06140 [Anaerolineaceae bacterium]
MHTVLVHIADSEPIKAEVDELPSPQDVTVLCRNPRQRTDKDLGMLDEGVTTVIFPMHRVNYIQVLPRPDEEIEFPMPFRND